MSLTRILVTGGAGRLARELARHHDDRLHFIFKAKHELDITDVDQLQACLDQIQPDVVINLAANTRTDNLQAITSMWRTNALGAWMLGLACQDRGIPWWHFSTDYVFDGQARQPYQATLPTTAALGHYGQSKAWAERALMRLAGPGVITRVGWLLSGQKDFVSAIIDQARQGHPLHVTDGQWGTPTPVTLLASWMIKVLLQGLPHEGVHLWHAVPDGGAVSRYELAQAIVNAAGLEAAITPCALAAQPPRPAWCVLASHAPGMPALGRWQSALAEIVDAID